jgi:hypothetical protein
MIVAAKSGSRIVYQETLTSWVNIGAFSIATLVLLYAMFIQGGTTPGFFSFALLAFLVLAGINFSKLSILITTGGIIVGYGFFKQVLSWNQIETCSIDRVPSAGWLIQITGYKGKHQVGYHIFAKPKIKLEAKNSWFNELTFSTNHPEHVLEILTKGENKKGKKKS